MADNVVIKDAAGNDVIILADELAGAIKAQMLKMGFGGDGLFTMVEDSAPLPVKGVGALCFTDTTSNQTAGAQITPSHDVGIPITSTYPWCYYNVMILNSHASTFFLEISPDGTNWYRASQTITVTANIPQFASIPLLARHARLNHTQGGVTSTTFIAVSSFSVN